MNAFFPTIKQNHHFMFLAPAGSSFDESAPAKKWDKLYLTLPLIGQPLLRRRLSLQMHEANARGRCTRQMHEALRQRIDMYYHLEGLTREELDAYLAQQLKAAGVAEPLFDDTARQGLYQATKGIPRKVNKLAMTALRLATARKAQRVDESVLLDATAEALL